MTSELTSASAGAKEVVWVRDRSSLDFSEFCCSFHFHRLDKARGRATLVDDCVDLRWSLSKRPLHFSEVSDQLPTTYGGDSSMLTEVHNAYRNKDLFLTEQSIIGPPGSATHDVAEPVRRVLIGATRNWCRNVLLWNLAVDPKSGPHTDNGGCTMCSGAITLDGDNATFNVAFYAAAHFSKFVPQGSIHIGSNELEQLANVAFLTPGGKVVIVVANTSNFAKTFHIGFHDNGFSTNLPAESVGTHVW